MDGILERVTDGASSDLVAGYRHRAHALMGHRRFAEAEALAREALRVEPDCPELLNLLGSAIWEQGRAAEAEPIFVRAHELKPDDWMVLNNLGLSLWDQGRPAEAAECYRQVLNLNPDSNDARMNLGVVLSDQGKFDEALVHLREAAQVDPQSPDAWQNLGMTLGRTGNWVEALENYERAMAVRPEYAEVHRNRAYGWLQVGDFERGWPEHEWRFKCRKHIGCRINRPQWDGGDLEGRPILLHAEQGYGDTLQFIRYAEVAKQRGGVVVVVAQTRLLRVVARCRGVDMALDGTSYVPDCEVHASLMSLPAILKTTQRTVPARIPYIFADPVVVDRWHPVLAAAIGGHQQGGRRGATAPERHGRPFLVGVAWQGAPNNPNDHWRSFPLAKLAPLADVPGVRLVSVQAADGLEQLAELDGRFPIVDLPSRRPREFTDTAAILGMLDLVITPDTAVAHLAGGMGIPVWLALSTVGEWRWMAGREDSPWYPTMRIFRQSRLGDWDDLFRRMADVLRQRLSDRSVSAA